MGTNPEAGPGCVCTGALLMLNCRLHYRDSICRDCSVSPTVEGGREGLKIESEAHSGGVTRAADEDAGAVAFAVGTEHGGHRVPGGAGGRDGRHDPAGPGDAISPGVPGGPSDLADPRGPSAAGESGGTASAILQIPGASQAPGPGGDAAPRAGVLSNQALQSYPIPGAPVGWAAWGVEVQARGGLGGCRWLGLNCRRRVLWGAAGYGSGVVWLSVRGR